MSARHWWLCTLLAAASLSPHLCAGDLGGQLGCRTQPPQTSQLRCPRWEPHIYLPIGLLPLPASLPMGHPSPSSCVDFGLCLCSACMSPASQSKALLFPSHHALAGLLLSLGIAVVVILLASQ